MYLNNPTLSNLNCFIPIAVFLGVIVSQVIVIPVAFLVSTFHFQSNFLMPVIQTVAAIAVTGWVWSRFGLCPMDIPSFRHSRFTFGHVLVFIGNAASILQLFGPIVLSWITGNGNFGFLYYGVFFVVPGVVSLWIIGLAMIYTSKPKQASPESV